MAGSRGKKVSKKAVKMPEGATPLNKTTETLPIKDFPPINKSVEDFCDAMAESDWQPFCARPKHDIVGFYVICRWYKEEESWAMMYVGKGHIKERLDMHFLGKQKHPITMYLSSFPKQSRNLLWLKWMKDPFHPYEGMALDDVINVLTQKYNNAEIPAFNQDLHVEKPKDHRVPEGFSILDY